MHLSQEIARFSATRQLSCGLRPDRLLVDQNWTKKSNEADFAERKYHLSAYFFWWSQAGSNRRPPACHAGALPAELWPRSAPPL